MKICNDSCDSINKDMQVYVGGLNFGENMQVWVGGLNFGLLYLRTQ